VKNLGELLINGKDITVGLRGVSQKELGRAIQVWLPSLYKRSVGNNESALRNEKWPYRWWYS
jgi:hypothetical protein